MPIRKELLHLYRTPERLVIACDCGLVADSMNAGGTSAAPGVSNAV